MRSHFIRMKPSRYQQGVLDWLQNGKGNATCNAVAGSGKTTTLKLAAQQLLRIGLEPKDVKVIVFGKQNSLDLIAKFGREWKFSIQTLHSVGFQVLQQEIGKFRRDERIVSSKYRRIAEQKKLIPRKTKKRGDPASAKDARERASRQRTYKGSLTESNAISRVEHFLNPIDLARLTLSDLSVESIKGIADHHNLEGIHDFKRVSRAIANILIEGQEQAINDHRIDFTDMVWLPVEWGLNERNWFQTYKFVLVDECQDLNAAQLELSLMLAGDRGRMLYVGDPCQPPETKILKVVKRPRGRHNLKTEWVNIEDLKVGDCVYSYSAKDGHFYTSCKVIGITERYYKDELIVVKTESGLTSKYTKNHHCVASFEPFRNHYCVYLMQKEMQFRVGMSKVSINESGGTGPVARLRNEGADAMWILEFYESRDEAFIMEQAISGKFGLPQLVFSDASIRTPQLLEKAWQFIGSNFERAVECLDYFDRNIRYPLFKRDRQWQQSLKRPMVVQASNLVDGCLMLPYKNHPYCYRKDWEQITISKEKYEGSVFSLDVEKYHTYVADGIVTHNCQAIFGFSGADNRSYQNIVERTQATELPLSLCYRCPKSHIDLVNRIYPEIPIEPSPNAETGTLECIDKSNLWDEAHPGRLVVGDMVLSRKTAPLVSLCIRLIGQGIAATVKGKDIGSQIKSELEAIADITGFRYEEFNLFVEQYRKFKFQTYENLDNAEQLKENLADKLNALTTIYSSQPNAKSIVHLCNYIDDLFSDDESPITLSTCHRAKGLVGDRIFIIKPEDMPMVWERQLGWQKEQEDNLLYVALTRSKSTLYIVGQPDWFKDDKERDEDEDEETFLTFGKTSNGNTDKDAEALATSTAVLETSRATQAHLINSEDAPSATEGSIQAPEINSDDSSLSTVNSLQLVDDKDAECVASQALELNSSEPSSSIDVSGVMLLITKLFSYEEKCELLTLLTDEVTQEKWDRVFNCLLKDSNRSDRAVATECQVSAPMVGKVRKNMIEIGEIKPEAKRVDRRGRKHKSPIKSE